MPPKMNLIRSQPGGGFGPTMFTGHNNQQHQRVPPVRLHLDVDPPILDTMEQPVHNTYSELNIRKPYGQEGRTFLRTLCQTISKVWTFSPPVTWVTPEVLAGPQCNPYSIIPTVVPQYPQATMHVNPNTSQITSMPKNPNTKTLNPDAPLWYPANQGGSQWHSMDPLCVPSSMWQEKADPMYHPPFKLKKPLNPEAKEWVPKNYCNSFRKTSGDDASVGVQVKSDQFSVCHDGQVPIIPYISTDPVISRISQEFCEITEDEVSAVRKNTNEHSLSTKQDENPVARRDCVTGEEKVHSTEPEHSTTKVSHSDKLFLSENKSKTPDKMRTKLFSDNVNLREVEEVVAGHVTSNGFGKGKQGFNEGKASSCLEGTKVSSCDHVNDSSSFSYASIVGRTTPSSPPSPNHLSDDSDDSSDKFGKVIQPLPKVFVKDKKYPKEIGQCVETVSKNPGLFKTVSKSQKAKSRNFLNELKSSPLMSQNNENSDFIISVELSFSPETSMSSSPKSDTSSLLGSPASVNYKTSRSWPDCTISNHHDRTTSESSVTSLESVDIEFGEVETEIKSITDNIRTCRKICDNLQTPKGNNFLACILGGDESESDESDEEEDDDWDKVSIEADLNDPTWEIFGFGLYLPGSTPNPCSQVTSSLESLACDTVGDDEILTRFNEDYFDKLNKKWEEEVGKDVLPQSDRRVKFGNAKIHPMVTWSFAYKSARRGEWEQFARDRARFSQRIASLEPILSVVLDPDHRDSVYKKLQQAKNWPS